MTDDPPISATWPAILGFGLLWLGYLLSQGIERTGFDLGDIDLGASLLHAVLAGLVIFVLWPAFGARGRIDFFIAAASAAAGGVAVVDEGLYEPLFEPATAGEGLTFLGAVRSIGEALAFVLLSLVAVLLGHLARRVTRRTGDKVEIAVGHERRLVERSSIVRLEAERDFVRVVTDDETFLASMTLVQLVDRLGGDALRIHKSHAVMLGRIMAWTATRVATPAGEVPIGRAYRAAVRQRLAAIASA